MFGIGLCATMPKESFWQSAFSAQLFATAKVKMCPCDISESNTYAKTLDHVVGDKLRLFFRFSDTPSSVASHGNGNFATPAMQETSDYASRTYTGGANFVFTSRLSNEFRLNYTSNRVVSATTIGSFGGNTPVDMAQLAGVGPDAQLVAAMLYGGYEVGISQGRSSGVQRQWNFVDTVSLGYLKAAGFPGQVGMDVAHAIDHAISELRDCDRLIVDLRGNPGGGAGGLRLMGYMTPDKLPVGYSLSKKRAERGYDKEKLKRFDRIPSRKMELYGLMFRFAFSDKSIVMVTEGLGPQPFHGRIVLLVNQHTASMAETVTGFARENKLATIIGTNTAGQVLGGTGFKVGHEFVLRIPVMTFHTWNGDCLEGKGVEPDYNVELSRDALKQGKDAQLQKAIEVAGQL